VVTPSRHDFRPTTSDEERAGASKCVKCGLVRKPDPAGLSGRIFVYGPEGGPFVRRARAPGEARYSFGHVIPFECKDKLPAPRTADQAVELLARLTRGEPCSLAQGLGEGETCRERMTLRRIGREDLL